jgi:colanic acid/amylovoran biosynthesis glycosyltransferase
VEYAVSTDKGQRILVFSTVGTYSTGRILDQVKALHKSAVIVLLTPLELVEDFNGITSVDSLFKYERQRSLFRTGITLLRRLRKERFDSFIVLCRDTSKTSGILSLIILSLFIPCRERMLMDASLVSRVMSMRSEVVSIFDFTLFPIAALFAKLLTYLITLMFRASYSSIRLSVQLRKPKGERVAVLLPILPDLSHIFIYREVLAMQYQLASFDVIALEEGDYGILHPEAKALLRGATFIPKISRTRYLGLYLYFLITHPVRLARLISLYTSTQSGGKFLLLDMNHLHNPLHPLHGIALAWELKKRDVAYIHVYGSTYPTTRGIVASFLLDIPFSMSTFVDFDPNCDFKMFREKVELARFIIATTRYCADRIRSYFSEEVSKKIHVIYLGIDQSYGSTYRSDAEHVPDRSPCFVAVGRFVEKKGFEYLVKAVAKLKERRLAPRCVIVGDGPGKDRLRTLIKSLGVEDCVGLVGPLPNDQLARSFLKPNNILVAPSVYARDGDRDGIPTILLEAMLSGLAVISTMVSGIPELIKNGENGILVPERDESALADAMEMLLKGSCFRERLRAKGREVVLENFRIDKSAQNLWSLIGKEVKAL